MVPRLLLYCLFLYASNGAVLVASPASIKAPEPLLAQVQRLTELLRDRYAVWYPDATMVQYAKPLEGEELVLAVFTVEGYGGGNGHTQYFAAFHPEIGEEGERRFSLIDVIPIAGKGWRGVMDLDARVTRHPESDGTLIAIDALEVAGGDPPNFPSKKITISLLLKDGRLVEQR